MEKKLAVLTAIFAISAGLAFAQMDAEEPASEDIMGNEEMVNSEFNEEMNGELNADMNEEEEEGGTEATGEAPAAY